MEVLHDIVDLTLASLRGSSVIKRYRMGGNDQHLRVSAALHGRKGSAGEIRIRVRPKESDALVEVWWRQPLLGSRWWRWVGSVEGAIGDPYSANFGGVQAVLDDIRRWSRGSVGAKSLNQRYRPRKMRSSDDGMWEKGMVLR